MGNLEKEVRDEIRGTKIQKAILRTIGGLGLLSVAVLAPNALQALGYFGLTGKNLLNKNRAINNSRNRLIEHGLIEYNKDSFLCLTEKGEKKLIEIEAKDYKIIKPQKWDKKWRILICDIKEEKRSLREKIRNTLMSIGFVRLQDSVWVFPYDCEDLITLLKADFRVGKDLLYIIADKIEYDKIIREQFGLEKESRG